MPFAAFDSVWIWVLLASASLLLVWILHGRKVQSIAVTQPERPPSVDGASLAQGLVQASDPEQALQLTLSYLAQPLALGAALAALWDAPNERLTVAARWGVGGEDLPDPDALGLMKQCALSARPQLLTGAAAQRLRIRSGLGSMAPRSLLLWPLCQGTRVLGVLELASLRELTQADQQALRELESLLALALRSSSWLESSGRSADAVRAEPAPIAAIVASSAPDLSALSLVRQSPWPMALYAESGRALALSTAWAEWLGLAPELAASRNLRSFWMRADSQVELLRLLRQQPGVQAWSVDLAHAHGHALAARLSACWVNLAGQQALLLVRAG